MKLDEPRPASGVSEHAPLSEGLITAFKFSAFNALSFQIVLGSPMVLYASSLEASATVLGIITGMMPLLVIFQIPAASHVARIGYKRFVYAGWSTRVGLIFAIAVIPLTPAFLDPATRLALLLFLLFGFNLSRGISSAAWLPWISSLVPVGVRGRYLAREAACVHVASACSLLVAAIFLGREPSAWQFSLLFLISATAGVVSLYHLKHIPDVPPPEAESKGKTPVPWMAIARFKPFQKLLGMNVAWAFAYGGLGTFTVAFLKLKVGMADGTILILVGLAFLGGLMGLGYFESRTDRLGSRPVLLFCMFVWLALSGGWLLVSARVVEPRIWIIVLLEFFMGFSYALVNMNNTRIAMQIAPEMGRSHFFALFSVVSNLALGLAPVLWGLAIDAFGARRIEWGRIELNEFSFFFAGVFLMFSWTSLLTRNLDEPKAVRVDELITELLKSPQRLWLRLWPRQ